MKEFVWAYDSRVRAYDSRVRAHDCKAEAVDVAGTMSRRESLHFEAQAGNREITPRLARGFDISKFAPSDTLPAARSQLLNLWNQRHQVGNQLFLSLTL